MEEENLESLKKFLLDIDCLEPLEKWAGKFNLFDVLKISHTEIRHSNMLAWLLSPNEKHGFGDKILKGFVQYVIKYNSDTKDSFPLLLMDYSDFIIQREWNHIDLIAISEKSKFILCIENKIDSGEHDNQLQRYQKTIEEYYPEYNKNYIFLSPEGIEASEHEHWISMSYKDVLDIIEKNKTQLEVSADIKFLIENYVEIIRRDIMKKDEVEKICREIYFKHKKALDLIYENRPDKAFELSEIIKKWAKEKQEQNKLIFDSEHTNKTYTRFRTTEMDNVIPFSDKPDSAWGTKNHYFYEVQNDGKKVFMKFVVNSDNATKAQKELFENINNYYPTKNTGKNWHYRVHFSTDKIKIYDDDEIDESEMKNQLDKAFIKIQKFEKQLISKRIIKQ